MISNLFHNLLISAYSSISKLNYSNQFMICSTAISNLTDGWFWSCDKNISGSNCCLNANEVMSTQANDSANSSFWNAFSDLSKLSYCYCTQKQNTSSFEDQLIDWWQCASGSAASIENTHHQDLLSFKISLNLADSSNNKKKHFITN